MRFARALSMLTIAAIIAMATTAATASAVESTVEGGTHCSSFVAGDHTYTGGCLLNASGPNSELRDFLGIMHVCSFAFSSRINEEGEGFVYNQVLSGGSCGLQPCREGDGHAAPWPFEITGPGSAPNTYAAELVLCVTGAFGIVANCHLNFEVEEISHNHYRSTANSHFVCEGSTNGFMLNLTFTAPSPGFEIT